jgi:hypothetical protein
MSKNKLPFFRLNIYFALMGCFFVALEISAGQHSPIDDQTASPTRNLYVSTVGSDSNPGTSSAPFLSIEAASRVALPNTTIHVAPGIYKGNIITEASGTAPNHIIYVSDQKQKAKIIGTGSEIAWINHGDYVELNGFDISTSGRIGFYSTGSYGLIHHCLVHDILLSGGSTDNGGAAIDFVGKNWIVSYNTIRNIDVARHSGSANVQGIYIAGANALVYGNRISGVAAYGIHQWHGATKSLIMNNTIFNSFGGILIGSGDSGALPDGSKSNFVISNIASNNLGYGIREYGVTSENTYIDNVVFNNQINIEIDRPGDVATGTIVADPMFVKYLPDGMGDYHLKHGSPATGRGDLISSRDTTAARWMKP